MQEQFEKLVPSEGELDRLWEEATFVFDTNVLLDLYTHDNSTTNDLLRAIEFLQERLFMPHQVLVEFTRNRSSRIKDASTPFDKALEFVDQWEEDKGGISTLEDQIDSQPNVGEDIVPLDDFLGLENSLDKLSDIVQDIANTLRDEIEESREKHLITRSAGPNIAEDAVLDKLFKLYDGRVGPRYGHERYLEIMRDAEWRRERHVPPGFEDLKGGSEGIDGKDGYYQYGDQILWHQVVDYAVSEEVDIILVTNDTQKEDWREDELRQEFLRRSGRQFLLYEPSRFLKEMDDRFSLQIGDESVDELEEASEGYKTSNGNDKLYKIEKPERYLEELRKRKWSIKKLLWEGNIDKARDVLESYVEYIGKYVRANDAPNREVIIDQLEKRIGVVSDDIDRIASTRNKDFRDGFITAAISDLNEVEEFLEKKVR